MAEVSVIRNEECTERLSGNQKVELVRLFLPYWREDAKRSVALMIAKAFYWNNISLQDALSVVKVVCELTDDEEVDDWLEVVKEAYQNEGKKDKPYEERLQGIGFFEYDFDKLVMNLLNIIKGLVFAGNSNIYVLRNWRVLIKVDFESRTTYEVRYIKRKGKIDYKIVMSAVPHKVVILQSENMRMFKVTFKSMTGELLHFEGEFLEIAKQIKRALSIVAKSRIEDILSLTFWGMIKLKLCEYQKLDNAISI